MSVICRTAPTIRRPRKSRTTEIHDPELFVDRDELERWLNQRTKTETEPNRTSLCIGCHIIGWFELEPLEDIIAELERWADDPDYLATLGWPRSCNHWTWDPHEDIGVWRGNRLLALVTRRQIGVSVKIFE